MPSPSKGTLFRLQAGKYAVQRKEPIHPSLVAERGGKDTLVIDDEAATIAIVGVHGRQALALTNAHVVKLGKEPLVRAGSPRESVLLADGTEARVVRVLAGSKKLDYGLVELELPSGADVEAVQIERSGAGRSPRPTYMISGNGDAYQYDQSGLLRRGSFFEHISMASKEKVVLAAKSPAAKRTLAARDAARDLFLESDHPVRTISAGRTGTSSLPLSLLERTMNTIAAILLRSRREFGGGNVRMSQGVVAGNSGSGLYDSGTDRLIALANSSSFLMGGAQDMKDIVRDVRRAFDQGRIHPEAIEAVRYFVGPAR